LLLRRPGIGNGLGGRSGLGDLSFVFTFVVEEYLRLHSIDAPPLSTFSGVIETSVVDEDVEFLQGN